MMQRARNGRPSAAISQESPDFTGTYVKTCEPRLSRAAPRQLQWGGPFCAQGTDADGRLVTELKGRERLHADKLQIRYQYDRKTKSLIVEGVLGIAQGESPHVIDEILGTYLQEGGGAAPEGEPADAQGAA